MLFRVPRHESCFNNASGEILPKAAHYKGWEGLLPTSFASLYIYPISEVQSPIDYDRQSTKSKSSTPDMIRLPKLRSKKVAFAVPLLVTTGLVIWRRLSSTPTMSTLLDGTGNTEKKPCIGEMDLEKIIAGLNTGLITSEQLVKVMNALFRLLVSF